LARVGDYEITLEQFNQELQRVKERSGSAGTVFRKRILDNMIRKELLIREAHKQGLDRREDFINRIKDFWERSLLKTLLAKKSREISGMVHVYDYEVEEYFDRLSHEIKLRVVVVDDEGLARELLQNKKAFGKILNQNKSHIVEERIQWQRAGVFIPSVERELFSLAVGELAGIIETEKGYAVARLLDKRRINSSLSLLPGEARREIRHEKETEEMDKWMRMLYEGTEIKINYELLEKRREP